MICGLQVGGACRRVDAGQVMLWKNGLMAARRQGNWRGCLCMRRLCSVERL